MYFLDPNEPLFEDSDFFGGPIPNVLDEYNEDADENPITICSESSFVAACLMYPGRFIEPLVLESNSVPQEVVHEEDTWSVDENTSMDSDLDSDNLEFVRSVEAEGNRLAEKDCISKEVWLKKRRNLWKARTSRHEARRKGLLAKIISSTAKKLGVDVPKYSTRSSRGAKVTTSINIESLMFPEPVRSEQFELDDAEIDSFYDSIDRVL
jgi:hypothetical protein